MARKGGRSSVLDEDFYSSLAAGVSDGSDDSEADPKALASSLKGLDDMDDDILGSLTTKKKSHTLPAQSSASKSGNFNKTSDAAKSGKPAEKQKFDIDDIFGDDNDDLLKKRPNTTDDTRKSKTIDFSDGSKPRPATTEQPKKTVKKYDFGDFDEDDPLAGLDLSDDEEPKSKKVTPTKKTGTIGSTELPPQSNTDNLTQSTSDTMDKDKDSSINFSKPDIDFGERPVTRSGSRLSSQDNDLLPIKSRSKATKNTDSDSGSNWDESSETSDKQQKENVLESKSKPAPTTSKQTQQEKPAAKKKDDIVFSDDDDDLDLGLDDGPSKVSDRSKAKSTGIMDSLFGKADTVEKHLQRPGTGGSQRELSFEKFSSKPSTANSENDVTVKKKSDDGDDDDNIFGSYAPSALSSRPGTGRSVRFEDEEPSLSATARPATADATKTSVDDWLGLGSKSTQQRRPLGLASTTDFSSSVGDDWLDMASGTSRPKTAPEKVSQKPPRTPVKKQTTVKKSTDDWLAELTAQVDDETDTTLNQKIFSRQSSAEKQVSRQGSVESTASNSARRPALVKQKSADDWLGLGDEIPIESKKTPALSKSSTLPIKKTPSSPTQGSTSDWLGLSNGDTSKDEDDWIKAAKNRRASQQADSDEKTSDKDTTANTSGSFVLNKSKEHADERSLDVLQSKTQVSTSDQLPWEKNTTPVSKPASQKQAVISSIFDDEPKLEKKDEKVSVHIPTVSKTTKGAELPKSKPVFQPMFASVPLAPYPNEFQSEYHQQMDQMQQQYNKMMEMRQQQHSAFMEQQRKITEEALYLQNQHIQASSSFAPSPVFPVGLSPVKQSELQLNNVELEGKLRRSEHEKQHLESLISGIKQRHQEEVTAIEKSNNARILMVEESYQRREFRLREEIEQLTTESLTKLRLVEEEKASLISNHYRKIDELEQRKSVEIEKLREQHKRDVEQLKNDHELALSRLRRSKELEMEAIVSTHSNPQSLQFLMEQMKQNASSLTEMQFKIGKSHQGTLDEREIAMNTRDQQLKVLQDCLLKQQEENDKERTRLQELLAKMEIQLREQERQLHQERWTVSQEKSKLAALQTSVEQERSLLTDQLTRERSELSRAKDSFLAEQKQAMTQLADERRLLSEERAQLTISQRVAADKEGAESLRQTQDSAKYEGLLKTLESERESLMLRSNAVSDEEKRLSSERAIVEKDKEFIHKEQERLAELAKKLQTEMANIEQFSKDCIEKEKEGRQALLESKRLDTTNQNRLGEITSRLDELKAEEKRSADERLQLVRERDRIASLKAMNLCAGCKQPITRNPYFSLSTPIPRNRAYPQTVGIVAPQQIDLNDPSILRYKIQADQDNEFLNEETMYLEALKYSPYHKK